MNRFLCLFSVLILFAVSIPASAQNRPGRGDEVTQSVPEQLRRRSLIIDIESRVLGEDKKVVWSENNNQVVMSGNPVVVQLLGSNIKVSVQFTPFIQRDGNALVAQGEIWIVDSKNKVTYYTSIQTIPMEYGEKIYYFPLGAAEHLNPSIEMVVTVTPETGRNRRPANTGND